MRKLWTDEENELIRLMREQGLTCKQMKDHLPDRTIRAIAVQANKILPPTKQLKPWTPEEEQKLIELRLAKIGYKEIATILGRSYPSVKTKGSILTKTIYDRSSTKMVVEERKHAALSDLSKEEIEFIDTGQEFFRF